MKLGVPVAFVEDQHQFILEHRILWQGGDTDAAVPLIEATQRRFPELLACSFDRGLHSPANQTALGDMLELNAMPARGCRELFMAENSGNLARGRQTPRLAAIATQQLNNTKQLFSV